MVRGASSSREQTVVLPSLRSSGIDVHCPVKSGQSTADWAVWGEGLGGTGWPEILSLGAGLQPRGLASCFCCRSCLPFLCSLWTLTSRSPVWTCPTCGPRDNSTTGQTPACQQRKTRGPGLGGRRPRPEQSGRWGLGSFSKGRMRLRASAYTVINVDFYKHEHISSYKF